MLDIVMIVGFFTGPLLVSHWVSVNWTVPICMSVGVLAKSLAVYIMERIPRR